MRNFRVCLDKSSFNPVKDSVVVAGISQATGLASMLLSKGKNVTILCVEETTTHKNTHAALAYLEVEQMELEYDAPSTRSIPPVVLHSYFHPARLDG